jgi:NADPH2:quinone reductase
MITSIEGMKHLKAIQFSEYGKPDVLQVIDVPVPTLKPGGVLVQVKAAGVNFADTARPLPYIPGSEAAGVITDVSPDVTSFKVGDRVVALTEKGAMRSMWLFMKSSLFPFRKVLILSRQLPSWFKGSAPIIY